jgi:ABC-type transport system substrate-binding protein
MLQKLRKKEFDACILGWAMSWKSDPFQIWHGSQAELPESGNHIGYSNPKVDALIEKLRVTMDEKEQQPLYHEIHQILYAEQPYVFLLAEKATAGYDQRLDNIKYYKIRPCVDTREWTSSKARPEAR